MTFVRHSRRVLVAAAAMGALFATAACGGTSTTPSGGGSSGAAADDFSQVGPITYVQGKDTSASGTIKKQIAAFNEKYPDEKVTLRELTDQADEQRTTMIQNAQNKSDAFSVLSVDVVWTAEFAANGYIDALPEDQFDTSAYLPATVNTAKYFNKLYAIPVSSDGGLLYYRTDLLKQAGIAEPPKTWSDLKQACATIKAKVPSAADMDCFAGQYQKYEGLTVNVAENIDSAGGSILGDDGKPTVTGDGAKAGMNNLVGMFKDGTIPKAATTWKEEEGRVAFQSGKLMFLRNWPYVYANASKTDGSSKVNGKFAVAPLPGLNGPGVSSLGGHNMAISKFSKNKGTAIKFIKFMASEEQQTRQANENSSAPTLTSLYEDAALAKKLPYLPVLGESIKTAKPRPVAVKYGDVTLAIQDAGYNAIKGTTSVDDALNTLQTKLTSLTSS